MTRREELWRVLLILAVPVLLFASPRRLDALSLQTFFADVNRDGQLETVELLSDGTHNNVAARLCCSIVLLYPFRARLSPFARVLAGDFDQDGDLEVMGFSGRGPEFVLLHDDGHGNFELVDNPNLRASELRRLISNEANSGLQLQRPDVITGVLNSFNYSKDLTFALAWYASDCIFRTFSPGAVDLSARASPHDRFFGRSPPLPFLLHASFRS